VPEAGIPGARWAARAAGRVPQLSVEGCARKRRAASRMRAVRTWRLLVLALPAVALALTPRLSPAGGDPFPAVPGWRLTGQPSVYSPANLWDFIDGAAESYLAYSFVELQVGEYIGPESVAVRVEIYRHADGDNAFGIYSMERAPDYSFIEVGAQGYQEEGVLNFLTGNYYVKLSTHQKGSAATAALRSIAGHIDTSLAGGSMLPAGLQRLPSEGKRPNTEGYVGQNFLGYGFLQRAFTARYDRGLQLFVMEYPTADSAAGALRRFLSVAPGTQTGPDRYSISDPNNGPIAIARNGVFLYGIAGEADTAVTIQYLKRLDTATTGR